MRRILVRWHAIRVLLGVCSRTKKASAIPDEVDMAEASDENLDLFWGKIVDWSGKLLSSRPGWTFDGSVRVGRDD